MARDRQAHRGGRLAISVAVGALALLGYQHGVSAATYYWDGDGDGALGGTGTWDNSSSNWWTGASGGPPVTTGTGTLGTWPGGANIAYFSGASGTVTIQNGTSINVSGANGITFGTTGYDITSAGTGAIKIGNTSTLSISSSGATVGTISAAITGQNATAPVGGHLSKTGNGVIVLSGTNTYTRSTQIQNGTLSVSSIAANLGNPEASPTDYRAVKLGYTGTSGTLRYTGAGETMTRGLDFSGSTGGGGLEASGNGAFIFAGPITTTGVGAKSFVLGGTNTGANDFQTAIPNAGANAISVTKTGGGTWILSGDNTYTGNTLITGGKLLINGGATAGTNTSNISVNSGGTLGGDGIVRGNITVVAGAKLSPGDGAGIFTVSKAGGSVTITGAVDGTNTQSLLFDLDTPSTSDKVFLSDPTSALTISGATGRLAFDDFVFSPTASFGGGTYVLFDTNAAIIGTLASTGLTGTIGGLDASIALSGDGQDIVLTVIPEPAMASLIAVVSGLALIPRRRRS